MTILRALVACLLLGVCTVRRGCHGLRPVRSVTDTAMGLTWVPGKIRDPYITFLNDFHYPSWRSRNPISKEPEKLLALQLPKGLPFAIACGSCYSASQLDSNLTMSISGNQQYEVIAVKPSRNTKEFRVFHHECLLSYMITSPLQSGGKITCQLNRGFKPVIEELFFSVVTTQEPDTKEIEMNVGNSPVELHCPQPIGQTKASPPTVNVWHSFTHPQEKNLVGTPIPTLSPSWSLGATRYVTNIACSVYALSSPTRVDQLRYRIISDHLQGSSSSVVVDAKKISASRSSGMIDADDEDQELDEAASLPTYALVLIIASVVVVTVGLFWLLKLKSSGKS